MLAAVFAANFRFASRGKRLLPGGRSALADLALLVARGGGTVLSRVAAVLSLVLFGTVFGRGDDGWARPTPGACSRVIVIGGASLAWSIH